MTTTVKGQQLADYIKESRGRFESELKTLVDIPSVSMDPSHKNDMKLCAERAAEILRAAGATASVRPTAGHPVVIGEFASNPEHPTVLVYNHLDVQPADAPEWQSPPFQMRVDGDRYLGRGTTDDKGPALSVLHAARYARQNDFPVNIKFVWELEEEIGSPHFEEFLKKHKNELKTDSIVVSDTIWISREQPAIGYGLRGLMGVLVRLRTGAKDVHSGLTGGLARNPIGELSRLISRCYDATTGEVHIPGFYDGVRPVTPEQEQDFVRSGFTTEGFKRAHELHSLRTTNDVEGAKRIWASPTFEVHGITGGYAGPGVKTIVPHQCEAKISMRLVPDQDPDRVFKLFEEFVKRECPDAEVIREGTLHPYLGDTGSPHAQLARQAMKDAFGKDPAFVREGGSIGAIVSMKNVLGKDSIFLGLSLPEHGYHAINEFYDWQQASGGMRMFVNYFRALSQMQP